MRSGTSYFNGTVFKKTVFRFWPLWAAYFVIWLIALPMNGLLLLSMQAAGSERTTGYMENFACRTVPGMYEMSLIMAVVFGLLCAMAVFSHLYNARSANFFGTLPVRREGLFLTHYAAGLAFFLVPNGVVFLLTLIVEAMGGWVSVPGLLFWLGVSCGECFLFYSMAVFCAMFTGHLLALPVFYGVFNILASGLWVIGTAVLRSFYYGYTGGSGVGYDAAVWLTPARCLDSHVDSYYNTTNMVTSIDYTGAVRETSAELVFRGLNVVGVYVLAAAVLAVCAFLLYRVRRLESAGDVVSVRPMRPVFKYGVALCVGMAFGMGTMGFLHLGEIGLMVAVVAWGIAGYFAAQMLLDKSFRVFKKWKGAAAVTGVFIALFLVVGLDLTGFETRMPDPDDVEYVSVYGLDAMHLGDHGDYVYISTGDPGRIELAMALHRAAIGQRDGYRPSGGMVTDLRYNTSLNLTYTLKDGSTLRRSYALWLDPGEYDQEGTGAWALQQIYNDRDLFWEVYGFDNMERWMSEEGWWMEQARYSYYDYSEKYEGYPRDEDCTEYYYSKDAVTLYEAVKEDFRAGRIGVRNLSELELYSTREYDRSIRFTVVNGNGHEDWVSIFVQDTATSTLAALERLEDMGSASTRNAG